ncbi:hypothetical protein [Paenibacillus sp. USDA918EY]|uniref:hypothetical protein n=1 Tax=Paenibacillus sp. USDA918EY TaxID=2689575 RepID=UPI00135B9047|nr:hypothetical protein [Paenibacillus sp. USDA918EY]
MNPANILSFTKKTAAVVLLAVSLAPAGDEAVLAAGNGGTATPNVTINSALLARSVVFGQQKAVPASLRSFTEQVVDELSNQDSFQDWKRAGISYDPLGPGTHGWLATVSRNGKAVGYLILTSTDDGQYMLSEYGRGESMPYNSQALYQRLQQLGLLQAGSKLSGGTSIEARYSALLPVWKITPPGKKAIYLHGMTGEELPMQPSGMEKAPLDGLSSIGRLKLVGATQPKRTGTSDPYENLLWLQSPKLSFRGDQDLIQAVKAGSSGLVFTSPGHNADYGAPFVVTGLHAWKADGTEKEVLFAASGPDGSRYLPAAELLAHGEFRSLNASRL